jgi:hypothetical protein
MAERKAHLGMVFERTGYVLAGLIAIYGIASDIHGRYNPTCVSAIANDRNEFVLNINVPRGVVGNKHPLVGRIRTGTAPAVWTGRVEHGPKTYPHKTNTFLSSLSDDRQSYIVTEPLYEAQVEYQLVGGGTTYICSVNKEDIKPTDFYAKQP